MPRAFPRPTLGATSIAALCVGAALLARCGAPAASGPSAVATPTATPSAPDPVRTGGAGVTTASAEPEPAAALEPSAAPKADDAPRRHVVAAIGDSLTDEKVGGGGYLKVLRAACPESRFDDFGKGADMVNQMRRRFFRSVYPDGNASAAGYTDVIVFGGVNDLYSDLTAGRTPKKVARDLSAMYETAKKHGARVIAVTVAPWGGFRKYYNPQRAAATRELNAWIAEQPATGGVDVVVDAYALLSCGDPEVLCPAYAHAIRDGLHFGKPGHDKLGAALKERAFPHCR